MNSITKYDKNIRHRTSPKHAFLCKKILYKGLKEIKAWVVKPDQSHVKSVTLLLVCFVSVFVIINTSRIFCCPINVLKPENKNWK